MSPWRKLGRILIYGQGFAIFGLMCLAYLPLVSLIGILPKALQKKFIPTSRKLCHFGFRYVRWHCHYSGFVDMRCFNPHQVKAGQLLLANHLSMFDIVLLFSYFPNLNTLINSRICRHPLLGAIIRSCGYISLDLSDPIDGMRGFRALEEALKQGQQVVIFPEGTRSSTGQLGSLKNGPFRLAAMTSRSVTPIFFTSNQAFLNLAAFIAKEPGSTQLYAYIQAPLNCSNLNDRKREAQFLQSDFTEAYFRFIQSTEVLNWNRHKNQEDQVIGAI
ncbi:MAG: lysophospholipid acyltransferase family protein [Proteobacteria bacterium]|nr:lysophospholipid acyltransferase family protein [Pseudomonadota bacterium]